MVVINNIAFTRVIMKYYTCTVIDWAWGQQMICWTLRHKFFHDRMPSTTFLSEGLITLEEYL